MPFHSFELADIGTVRLYKHKRSRAIRITLSNENYIRVTMPRWLPYSSGIAFVRGKEEWIRHHYQPLRLIRSNQRIGKAHHIYFATTKSIRSVHSRTKDSELVVYLPEYIAFNHPTAQAAARKVVIRALRDEAEGLLPKRLESLATTHNYTYRSVTVRHLKSRWGSCSQNQDIVLNLHLMQLPWRLIDYVILHELAHTKVLHHDKEFWTKLESVLPGAKLIRMELKNYRPVI